jgi:hypothetical protein
MDLKKLTLAAAAGATLFAAAPAFSEPRDWARERDYSWEHERARDHRWQERHIHRDHYRALAPDYYPSQRVVERVVVVPAAPVYYNNPPARPVISGQIPIGRDRNINIEFQL